MQNVYSQLMQFYHRFGKFYAHQFARLLAETGLTMREINVLLFLANNPRLDTARDVTEYRGIAKSQVSEAVEILTGRGLLCRTADAADRRVIHLAITEAGGPLARQAQEIQDACWRGLLMDVTPEEQAQLRAILGKIFASEKLLTKGETVR